MSENATLPEVTTQPKEKEEQKTKQMPPYNVVLLNDDDHSFEYVIHMLQKLFGYPVEKGYQMAEQVHTQGRVIVYTTYKELAEQITADHFRSQADGGSEITIMPILTGAMIFCADLIRHMPIAMRIGLLTVSSASVPPCASAI